MTISELLIKYRSKIAEVKIIVDDFPNIEPNRTEEFCLSRIKIYEEIVKDLEEEGPSNDT